VLVQRL